MKVEACGLGLEASQYRGLSEYKSGFSQRCSGTKNRKQKGQKGRFSDPAANSTSLPRHRLREEAWDWTVKGLEWPADWTWNQTLCLLLIDNGAKVPFLHSLKPTFLLCEADWEIPCLSLRVLWEQLHHTMAAQRQREGTEGSYELRVAEKPWSEGMGMTASWCECRMRRMWNKASVAVQARSQSQGPQPVRLWEKNQRRGNQRSRWAQSLTGAAMGSRGGMKWNLGLKQWTCGKNWPPDREVRK